MLLGWRTLLLASAASGISLGQLEPASACTTFFMSQGGPVVGKSYDWSEDAGLVVVNKRGVSKTALLLDPTDQPATWVSKYASVSFNQYGVELPNGGMNEAGLVVEIMWLDGTVYPPPDARPAVNELQWIQHALDSFADVPELAAAAPSLRVARVYADVHYLACDKTGACATFEYLGGGLVVTAGAGMVVNTLTNDTYEESAAYLSDHVGFGGTKPIPTGSGSLDRFVRASALAVAPQTSPLPDSAFSILSSVSQDDFSVWNIVYRPGEGRVHFRTHGVPSIKEAALDAFDPTCTSPRMLLDIATAGSGDVSAAFAAYTKEANLALLDQSLDGIGLPQSILDMIAGYPSQLPCTTGTGGSGGSTGAGGSGGSTGAGGSGGSAATGDGGSSGCTCEAAGAGARGRALGLGALVGLGALAVRRRRRAP